MARVIGNRRRVSRPVLMGCKRNLLNRRVHIEKLTRNTPGKVGLSRSRTRRRQTKSNTPCSQRPNKAGGRNAWLYGARQRDIPTHLVYPHTYEKGLLLRSVCPLRLPLLQVTYSSVGNDNIWTGGVGR